jgi:lipopolysaccharide transport system ATP-binding protein
MHSSLILQNVAVEFPIYNATGRSLKKQLMRATTGGRVIGESGRVIVKALENVSLNLHHGDRLGLLGHNGAGKTTLLRVLAGVYEPTAGVVAVNGRVTALFDVGLGLDVEATGYENIFLRGMLLGIGRRELQNAVDDIAAFTELGEYLHMPIRTYSSGMALRLAFGISTAVHPDILLMDEYFAVGDESFLKKAEDRLNELIERAGILVFASHSVDLIRRLCNKALVLKSGQVVASGPVDPMIAGYASYHASTSTRQYGAPNEPER